MGTTAQGAITQIIYIPPDSRLIIQFARNVCQEIAATGDPSFAKTEVIDGFAGFLNMVAQATTNQLNRHGEEFLDSDQLQG